MKRVALVGVIVAISIAAWLVSRKRLSAHSSQLSASDMGTTRAANGRARPAPPLRLTHATVVEDAKSVAGEFGGRVLSTADGKPIARASLTFLHDGAALSTECDGSGRFAVRATSAGAYELTSASARGFLPFEPQLGHSPVTVWARAGVRLDDITIYLSPAVALEVVVVDDKDKPLAGAEVRAFDDRAGPADGKAILTDEKGHASIEARGFDVVEARHAGYKSARARLGKSEQLSGRVTLRLSPGVDPARPSISGRVVDAQGRPVDGALVEALTPPDAVRETSSGAQTLSGVEGRFVLAGLVDGSSWDVRATTRGEGTAVAHGVRAGASDVELRLGSPRAILHGVVRDGAGKPITAFTVVAWPRIGVFGRGPDERATVIDPEGRYALPLPPGSYAVSAAARGFSRAPDQTIDVGDDGAEANFTLARGSRIFGRVVERGSGTPLAGANVAFEGHALDDGIGLATDATTDSDGAFALEGLPAGRQSLNVQAAGHNGRLLGALDVPREGALGPLTVDLAPTPPGEDPTTELVGIGATLAARPEGMLVLTVAPGAGASDAGIVPGDIVLTIDGQSVEPLGFVGSIQMIRGPEGSIVTLTMKRKDGSVQTIPVTRKRINF